MLVFWCLTRALHFVLTPCAYMQQNWKVSTLAHQNAPRIRIVHDKCEFRWRPKIWDLKNLFIWPQSYYWRSHGPVSRASASQFGMSRVWALARSYQWILKWYTLPPRLASISVNGMGRYAPELPGDQPFTVAFTAFADLCLLERR